MSRRNTKKVVKNTDSKTLSVKSTKKNKPASKRVTFKKELIPEKTEDSVSSIADIFTSEDATDLTAPIKTIDDKLWEVSNAFIDQYGLASMHTDSFNYAIEEMIPTIINEKGKISLLRNGETHYVEFTNLIAKSPVYKNDLGKVIKLIPKICMDKSLSYASSLYCDIIYKGPNDQINRYEKKYIGDIYIPVYSNLCNLHAIKGDVQKLAALQEDINDKGGYFILKGQQKVIVPQVRPSHNNIHIFNGKAASSNGKPKFSKYTEIKCGGLTSHITTVQVGICTKSGLISVSIPYIDSCSIPLGIVFCALGITSAANIRAFVFENELYENQPTPKHKQAILVLVKSLEQSWNILALGDSVKIQEAALYYIGSRGKKFTEKVQGQTKSKKDIKHDTLQTIEYAKYLLRVEFLPHINTSESDINIPEIELESNDDSNPISCETKKFENDKCATPVFFSIEKSVFLGYMTRKLLLSHVGLMPVSDRDHTANKRVHTSGMIMAAHFYKAFCQLTGKIVGCIDNDIKKKKPINVVSYITSPHIITTSFTNALMSNKWNSTGPVQGISQTIDNFNYVSYISCVRKFVIPMANEGGKIEPPRHLHGSQWGCSCLTGDTLITLADGFVIEISKLKNSMLPVMTVNKSTLKSEPSGIYNFIELISNNVYLVEDEAGNKIKCTGDHKFLVYRGAYSNDFTGHTTFFSNNTPNTISDKEKYIKETKKLSSTTEFVKAEDLTKNHVLIYSTNGSDAHENNIGGFLEGIDKILLETGKSFTRIKNITKLEGAHTVYDFTTISNNHTIIANNIVTSNCPYETPEGKRVGLVQVLATDSFITVGCDHYPIVEFLKDMNIIPMSDFFGIHSDEADGAESDINYEHLNNFLLNTRIFVNGIPQGYTLYPDEIINTLRSMRRKCNLNPSISLSYDKEYKEICISTDAGRMIRGVCVVNGGKLAIPEHILDGIKIERNKEKYSDKVLQSSTKSVPFCSATPNSFNIESSVWMYLLENGYVELIDKAEEENLNVAIYATDLEAMSKSERIQYTHCEMTPDMIEGIGANTSPKNDCNQAPRNIYQSAMAKQSIGVPGLNHRYHKKGKWHSLVYPQKPIVNTRIARKVGLDNVPMGQNATVLVMPWYGLNQEDSLVLNEDAINRGFMCSYAYVAYEATIEDPNLPGTAKYQEFKIPQENVCNDYRGNCSKLLQDSKWCYVPKGVEVCKGDILIGMVLTYTSNVNHINTAIHNKKRSNGRFETNVSIIYDQKWPSTVHSVTCGKNGDGYMSIRLVTRQYRKPVRGDKFAARHGQKGTVGEILPSEEMPFLVRLGYTPNILMNPLAFPSRMTIGLFVEAIMGISLTSSALQCPEYSMPLFLDPMSEKERKGCTTIDVDESKLTYSKGFDATTDYAMSLDGDASPFVKSFNVKYVLACIEKLGVPFFSEEEIIIPKTGERLQRLIFHGVMYYQRLKHMVVDKIHARSTGSTHALHRQPTEGRKKKGGFRVGHMERDRCDILTPIALKEGVSVKIGSLKTFETVWGWNSQDGLLVKSEQNDYGGEEKRPLYIITLQDGRTLRSAEHHPYYTSNDDKYSEVHELIPGVDRLACSLCPPLVDFEEDIKLCKYGAWDADFFRSVTSDDGVDSGDEDEVYTEYEVFRKSLALARLIGFAITDGHATSIRNMVSVYLGHLIDVETVVDDIKRITGIDATYVFESNVYKINLPSNLARAIRDMGIIKGAKVSQDAIFPNFIHEMTPQPILREFMGGLFGGDGHTCCLSMHRGKLDILKSVSISWTKDAQHLSSLQKHMETLKWILWLRFDIEATIQQPKFTTHAKQSGGNHKQILLNIPLTNLISFSEQIGFRYCEHKAIRLSAGVSYRRFRENVLRQRLWIVNRVDEITDYRKKKANDVEAKINGLAEAVKKAKKELELIEPILHKEAVPVPKRAGQLITGKVNNEIRSSTFPTVGEYMKNIGALKLFLDEKDPNSKEVTYGMSREQNGVPAYHLKVVDVRKQNYKIDMCDITVKGTESYVSNGVITHNCMLAQGVPEMVQDRLLYQSDVYKQPVCQVCGLPAIDDGKVIYCRVCQTSKCVYVQLPFGTKLLSQEFSVLNIVPRIITLPEKK
jgi:DNA-directed RNA polymerase beta subunit/intein/homing endonuclease